MTDSLVPVSSKTTSAISESSQAGGPSNFSPNDKQLREKPSAKSSAETQFGHQQHNVIMGNFGDPRTESARPDMSEPAKQVADAEDFLAQLKDSGEIYRNSGGLFAKMSQAHKEELVTFDLPRFCCSPHQKTNARRAMVAYADRYGRDAAMAFKDVLLQPRRHWINGNKVTKRPFKLLPSASDAFGSRFRFKAYEPKNLKRMGDIAVLGERLKSAGRSRPTLENVDRLLSQEDITALNDNDALFSKDGGSAPIRDLLHVATYRWKPDRVSGSENRQKIRDVMLLATAKEAAAAKAENRGLNLRKLKALKTDLLTAAKGGPQELAKRYNHEMAKLAFQPGPGGATLQLREIGQTPTGVETYRADFRASVEKWSEDNGHKFIGLSDLKKVSDKAIGKFAPEANQRKLDAHEAAVSNNQIRRLKTLSPKAKQAYLKELKSKVDDASKKGILLDDGGFNGISSVVLGFISMQRNVQAARAPD